MFLVSHKIQFFDIQKKISLPEQSLQASVSSQTSGSKSSKFVPYLNLKKLFFSDFLQNQVLRVQINQSYIKIIFTPKKYFQRYQSVFSNPNKFDFLENRPSVSLSTPFDLCPGIYSVSTGLFENSKSATGQPHAANDPKIFLGASQPISS